MKKVLGHYGSAVIAVCVVLGLSGVFQNLVFGGRWNLKEYLREMVAEALFMKPDSEEGVSAFDTYMNTNHVSFAVVDCDSDFFVRTRTIPVSYIMEAVDSTGQLKNMELVGCWDEQFQETKAVNILQNTMLRFRQDGIFWVEVRAADTYGNYRNVLVKIYVNER